MNLIELSDYFGYFGSFLSAITFIPQVLKAWQTKSVGDLSIVMMLIVVLSTIVWLCYAIMKTPVLKPVIIANAIILFLSLILIYFKFSFARSKKDI